MPQHGDTTGDIHAEASDRYPDDTTAVLCSTAFISIDARWCVTYWNEEAEKIFHRSSGEMMGKNLWDQLYPVLPVEFYGFYDLMCKPGAAYQFSYFWSEINAWVDISTFSESEGFSIALRTHTPPGSPASETQSRFLYPIYRVLTEASRGCLWYWKTDTGERFWIDGGLKDLFGYNIQNSYLPLQFWESRIHPEDLADVRVRIDQLIHNREQEWVLHYRFRNAEGKYIAVQERALQFGNKETGKEVIGAMYDVSLDPPEDAQEKKPRSKRQREIAEAIISAQETERHEIGYKLNEDLNQVLAIAKVYIQLSMKSALSRDAYLRKADNLIDQVIAGIRGITEEILLPSSNLIGLFENLQNLSNHSLASYNIHMGVTHCGFEQEELQEDFQFAVYRIIQEQIRAVAAGKKGAQVQVDQRRKGNKLRLLISDDRHLNVLVEEKGLNSFSNIRSRAGIFNGATSLYAGPGSRCTLKVVFPLNSGKEKKNVTLRTRS